MANVMISKAFEVADETAQKLGCYAVDIEYVKEGKDKILRIYIDKPEKIGIDECEAFSRTFEEEFDKLDIIKEAYVLEVSSPGVDRILKTEREFLYYRGREVDVKLYRAIENQKEFSGMLKAYEKDIVTVEANGRDIQIPIKEAVYIRLHFSM